MATGRPESTFSLGARAGQEHLSKVFANEPIRHQHCRMCRPNTMGPFLSQPKSLENREYFMESAGVRYLRTSS